MPLVVAHGELLEQILDATYPVWHEGLTRAAYGQWNAAQMRTPWGREHLQRYALVDSGGRLLSTAKRYRYDLRVDGRDAWMCGLGAVFTPLDRRGRGHAAELIRQLLDQERAAGAVMATLFSEIGEEFYRRLGFSTVPIDEVRVELIAKTGTPAMLVRAGADRDLADIAAMHAVRAASARFSLRRDVPQIHYALSKKRMFAGLSAAGTRQTEFFVAEEGSSAVAYVVMAVSGSDWTIEEAGDRDPAGARLGAMLQVLVAREPSLRRPAIRAWWPAGFPVPPQARIATRCAAGDLFMVRPLVDLEPPLRHEDVFYWRSDYF
jgi:GNAT superfamily N-acetyltransferase